MKRKLLSLFAACALFMPLACDNAVVNDPTLNPSFSAGSNGLHLRDTDANTDMPADTVVQLGDIIHMTLFASNGSLQNNKNVVWTNSNPASVSLTPNDGSATAVALALGTSTVCAALGSGSACVVIEVSPGPGVAYIVTSSSYAPVAGTSVTISAQLVDVANNPVALAGRIVTWSSTNGGSFTPPASVTDASGIVTTSFTVSTVAGTSHVVTATDDEAATGSSAPILVQAGAGENLAMHTQPSATAQAGVQFAQQPAVQLKDALNNDVATAGVVVTASIATGAGTLAGTLTATTDGTGRATFSDLRIDGVIGERTLSFSASGYNSVTSNTIDVVAGPAAEIVLTTPSTTVVPNTTVTITGQLRDQFGNNVAQVTSVSWSSTNGGSFSANPTSTDGAGQTTVDFTVASTSGVTHVVTATAGSASGTISITTYNTAPIANDDAFDAIGNVTIPVAAPGVLTNDTDAEQPVTAVAGTIATTNGGTVELNADGSFTYLSAAGFSGIDSFDYSATDGTATATATVTMTVAAPVWYVDNSATAPGDGRDASPFTELKSAETASAVNHRIFLLEGNGTTTGYDEGIVLKDGQQLIGQGVPADVTTVVNGSPVTLLSANGTPEVTRNTAGTTIQLAQNNTVSGVDVASTDGAGIGGADFGTFTASSAQVSAVGGAALELLSGTVNATFSQLSSTASAASGLLLVDLAGSLSAPAGSLTGAAGIALTVHAGDGVITYGGSITSVGPRPVFITGRTGGLVTVAGAITANGSGISVSDNAGGTVRFTGSASITTTDIGVALLSNPGTTIEFDAGNLDIIATAATGFLANAGGTISVTGAGNTVTATGSGVVIQNTQIHADGVTFESVSVSSGTVGIDLENTGSAGSLTVTGNGTAGSGGTIQNVSGDAVSLTGAARMDLRLMNIRPVVRGVILDNATGTSSISRSTIDYLGAAPAGAVALEAINTSGTLTLTLDGTAIQNKLDGNTAVQVAARGNSTINFNVVDSNTADLFPSRYTNLFGSALVVAAADALGSTGVVNARVTSTEFVNAAINGVNNAAFSVANNGLLDYVIRGNLFDNVGRASFIAGVIDISASNAGRIGSTAAGDSISGNTIRNLGTGTLATQLGYLGIRIAVDNTVAGINHNAVIANNTLTNIWRQGMLISSRGDANDVNVRITNNTIGTLAAPVGRSNRRGLEIESQTNSAMKVEVTDNPSIVGAGTSSGNASLAIRTGVSTGNAFMNATVLNNTIGSTSAVAGARFRAETASAATSTMCLDLRNNSLENNTKTFDLSHVAGVFNVEGAGTGAVTNAAIQAQNTIGTGLVTGTVTFNNNVNCAQPSTP